MGMHQRTDYNKYLIKIEKDASKINPKGGFMHYGLIKNDYLIIKGSIPGTANRPIILTDPVRPNKKILSYEIVEINRDSKQ
jgi:large subunit ribosomal protein L3